MKAKDASELSPFNKLHKAAEIGAPVTLNPDEARNLVEYVKLLRKRGDASAARVGEKGRAMTVKRIGAWETNHTGPSPVISHGPEGCSYGLDHATADLFAEPDGVVMRTDDGDLERHEFIPWAVLEELLRLRPGKATP